MDDLFQPKLVLPLTVLFVDAAVQQVRAKWRGKKILWDNKIIYTVTKSYLSIINNIFDWNPHVVVT